MPSSSRPTTKAGSSHVARGAARTWFSRHVGFVVATLAGVIILAPGLFQRGYFLRYDMVFVPHLALSASTAGLDGDVPRAVPNDLVVALFSTVLPGWLVQRAILLGAFCAIGAGVDRLRTSITMRIVAGSALAWNPWIAERLSIGHWGYLWGYAACVWACAGAWILREHQDGFTREQDATAPGHSPGDRRAGNDNSNTDVGRDARHTLLIALIMGALSGSTGDILVAIILAIMLLPPRTKALSTKQKLVGVGLWVSLGAAWWFPFFTLANSSAADAQGVIAFAAHSDGWGPTFLSLFAGGGIWHSPSWFPERATPLVAVLSASLLMFGMASLLARTTKNLRISFALLGATGLILSGAASLSTTTLVWVVQNLPGGGLLRDGQKFSCLWLIPASFGLGLLADVLKRRFATTALAPVSVSALALAPLALLPGLAFERGGQWKPANYPQEFLDVAHQLHNSDGGVAVFPWQLYRAYGWNGNTVVLDPWQRLLPGHVVVDDDLPLRSGIVRGESADSARISTALRTHSDAAVVQALKSSGVRYVIDQKGQPAGMGVAPHTGRVIHSGRELVVRDLGVVTTSPTARWAPIGLMASLGALIGVIVVTGVHSWPRRNSRKST